ncbi:heme-binding domain-containing protein [Larkinella bovis]|uniref:Heme-binding domain-containing protein n=1 Tax=Larkinella bovis TaxID=683041 RepID=A0ABW0IAX6_9BACT
MKRKILIGLLIVLVGIQFIRPARNEGVADTPQDVTHFVNVPPTVMTTLKTACYDCHSDKTAYPWYTHINPIGLWLGNHVKEGKAELNFSNFAQYDRKRMDHKLEEVAEEIEENHMPLSSYLIMHEEANLSDAQKQEIIEWVKTERAKLGVEPEP